MTFEVKVTDEGVQVGSVFLAHNEYFWRVSTNRHTTSSGNFWGWIGCGSNAEITGGYWSNDCGSNFTREMASAAVTAHNKWLEDIQPIQIKLLKAKRNLSYLEKQVEEKKTAYEDAKEAHECVYNRVQRLLAGEE